jgi:hypothetical protein
MVEVGGKIPRKPPMECWGCKGNHRYIDFPHKNDKVRAFHNVHQEEKSGGHGQKCTKDIHSLGQQGSKISVTYD